MALMIGSGSAGTIGKVGIPQLPGANKPPGAPRLAGVSAPKTVAGGFKLAGAPGTQPITQPKIAPTVPTAPKLPTTGAAPSAGSGGASTPAPLDATAMANIAAYLNKTGNQAAAYGTINQVGTDASGNPIYQGITGQAGADQTAYNASLNALQQQEPLSALKILSNDNARGGLYSSAYAQQQGNNTQNYNNKETGLSDTLQAKLGDLASRIAALYSSQGPEANQQAAASAAQLTKAAASTPAPPPPPPVPAQGAVGSFVRAGSPKGVAPPKNAAITGRVGGGGFRYARTRG